MKIAPVIGLAFAGFVALGYFVSRHELDTQEFDAKLRAFAEDRIAPVVQVDCPEVKMKKGVSFRCSVHFADGSQHDVAVEQKTEEGLMEYRFDPPIVDGTRMASTIQDDARAQGIAGLTASCGTGILVVPAAGLRCDVVAGKDSAHAIVTVDPKNHDIMWRMAP